MGLSVDWMRTESLDKRMYQQHSQNPKAKIMKTEEKHSRTSKDYGTITKGMEMPEEKKERMEQK